MRNNPQTPTGWDVEATPVVVDLCALRLNDYLAEKPRVFNDFTLFEANAVLKRAVADALLRFPKVDASNYSAHVSVKQKAPGSQTGSFVINLSRHMQSAMMLAAKQLANTQRS